MATVPVSNTPGLYQIGSNVTVNNNAQQLLTLLSNAGSVGFGLTNANTQVDAFVLPSGVTSGTYGDSSHVSQVTVGSDGRITNISNVSLNGTGTYSNANVASYLASNTDPTIIGINSNVTTVQNNLTAFETYANVHFGTSSYGNSNVQTYLSSTNILYIGNSAGTSSQVVIGDSANGDSVDIVASGAAFIVGSVGGNLSVSTSNGIWIENTDLAFTNNSGQGGNINMNQTSGKGFINNANVVNAQSYVSTNGYFWANGAIYTGSSSTYGNANVALLLSSYNIPVDAISFTTNGVISTSDSLNTTFGAGQPTGSIQAPFGGIGIGLDAYIKGNANVGNLQSSGSINTTTGVFWSNNVNYASTVTGTYSNANVASYLPTYSGNISAGNLTVVTNLYAPDIIATNVAIKADAIIYGNLTVQGNTTIINSNTVVTNDKILILANNQSTGVNVNGAGLEVGNPAVGTFLYNNLTTSWQTNLAMTPSANNSVALGGTLNYWTEVYTADIQAGTGTFTGNVSAGNINATNITTIQNNIATINANLGAFETSTTNNFNTINANVGAFETYSNTQIATINANLGAYQVYANANAASQAVSINTINANIGAFETYANATFATSSNLNSFETYANTQIATINANLGAFETYANTQIATINANLGAFETYANATFSTYGNANVASYLPTYSGDIGNAGTPASTGYFNTVNATTLSGALSGSQTGINAIAGYTEDFGVVEIQDTSQVYIHAPVTVLGDTTYSQITGINGHLNIIGNVPSGAYAGNAIVVNNGNVQVNPGYYYLGDGSKLTNLPAQASTYGNANVSVYLPHATGYTDGWQMPIGGNSARPSFAANGMIRYNSDIQNPEWYNGVNSTWYPFSLYFTPAPSSYSASYLIVAGGAGGGTDDAGGGGAGGLLTGTTTLSPGTTYSFTVGGGGGAESNGSNSTGFSLTAIGGGAGANGSLYGTNGTSGGSGGGGSADFYNLGPGTVTSGGSGTSGQGNAGGTGGGYFTSGAQAVTGGGGGAGAVGGNGSGSAVGNGGAGYSSSITGSATYYAGGGGGAGNQAGGGFVGGTGGVGGGGTGGYAGGPGSAGRDGYPGTANTGGGGGGGGGGAGVGGAGGSGVVILSVPTSNYSGTTTGSPTITTSGSNTIITFTSSGSYTA